MTGKKSFILYNEHGELFEQLSSEEGGKLMSLIFSYVREQPVELSELPSAVRIAFIAIKQDLDRNAEKYAEASEKRSAAAKKREEGKRRAKKGAFVLPCESTAVVDNDNVNVNANANGNVNVNANVKENANEDVNGNVNVNANGNVKENANEDVNVNANGNGNKNANADETVCAYAQSAYPPAEEPFPFDDDDRTEMPDRTAKTKDIYSDRTELPDRTAKTKDIYSDKTEMPDRTDKTNDCYSGRTDCPDNKTISSTSPTYEEVKLYCIENGYTVDPWKFVEHYRQKGWKTGKDPVRDWRALLRSWQSSQHNSTYSAVKSKPTAFDPYSPGSVSYDLDLVRQIDYAQYMDL